MSAEDMYWGSRRGGVRELRRSGYVRRVSQVLQAVGLTCVRPQAWEEVPAFEAGAKEMPTVEHRKGWRIHPGPSGDC